MNKAFLPGAALVGAFLAATNAWADTAETKGGFSIKTDDGRFSMNIGGRIHFDGNLLQPDDDAPFGSNTSAPVSFNDRSGVFFRRIYLTLKGTAYGWNYKIEPDFCGSGGDRSSDPAAKNEDVPNTCREFNFQDIYLSTVLGPGELFIGQRKRFAGMEELTSSNELTMQERPYVTANGLYSGRDFQSGLFYLVSGEQYTAGAAVFSLANARASTDSANGATRGIGYNARGTYAPLNADGDTVHLGASFSVDNVADGSISAKVPYAGRLGPTQTLATSKSGATTWSLEAATAQGPFYAQAEYGNESFEKDAPSAADPGSVAAWSVMTSFLVTGETKPYNKKEGLFKNPKPANSYGAVELTARYEQIQNDDTPTACGAGATECKVRDITVGANWYVNPNVRFMLNYIIGKDDRGAAGEDSPRALTARAQFSF